MKELHKISTNAGDIIVATKNVTTNSFFDVLYIGSVVGEIDIIACKPTKNKCYDALRKKYETIMHEWLKNQILNISSNINLSNE